MKERINSLWRQASQSARHSRQNLTVPHEHIPSFGAARGECRGIEDHVQVFVSQMHLRPEDGWFVQRDPLVLVVTEFIYAPEPWLVPFIIGSYSFGDISNQPGEGISASHILVAGSGPCRGVQIRVGVLLFMTECGIWNRSCYGSNLVGDSDKATNPSNPYRLELFEQPFGRMEKLFHDGIVTPVRVDSVQFSPPEEGPIDEDARVLIDDTTEKITAEQIWMINHRLYGGFSRDSMRQLNIGSYMLLTLKRRSLKSGIAVG